MGSRKGVCQRDCFAQRELAAVEVAVVNVGSVIDQQAVPHREHEFVASAQAARAAGIADQVVGGSGFQVAGDLIGGRRRVARDNRVMQRSRTQVVDAAARARAVARDRAARDGQCARRLVTEATTEAGRVARDGAVGDCR